MIDELIHYCIEQIGLDGEAGTDMDRFASFVRQFHIQHSSRSHSPDQLVDASYLAFVFRQALGHPHVSVGLFVPGVPFKSGAKSGITRKYADVDGTAAATPHKTESNPVASPEYDSVDPLPDQALAEQQGLTQLQQLHGDRLRLALHTTWIQRLLVGSDAAYLPPSAYHVLQIVCRSRETPVLSTDIGTALHTDQKTIFYICKRLIDLDLVIKFQARETGTVANYFVATRFEHRCDILVRQRNADNAADLQLSGVAPLGNNHPFSSSDPSEPVDNDNADAEEEDVDDQDLDAPTVTVKQEESESLDDAGTSAHTLPLSSTPTFEQIDAAKSLIWINSRPELVRLRIYLLCNSTSSKVTARHFLLRRINLASTRQHRKSFIKLLEHAVVDGLLEVVRIHVPSTGRTHRGFRMTLKGFDEMHELLNGDSADASSLHQQAKAFRLNAKLQQDLSRVDSCLPREFTLERHLHEQVARAGPAGRTISQLMTQLHASGHFARAVDQIAQRAEDADGEPAISDLRVRSFHEHKLRVRSTKLYSHHAWVLQSANDGFLDPDDLHLLASAGGFSSYHRKSTAWKTSDQVTRHLDTLSKDLFTPTPGKGKAHIGRPPKKRPMDDDPDAPPPKRGRPRKQPLPDQDTPKIPKKRGRPRKNPLDSAAASPADTDALPSPVPSSSRRTEASPMQETPQLDSSPVQTTSRSSARKRKDDLMEDNSTPTVPESPTAGVAKRRSHRLIQGQDRPTPTSLLASTSVTAAADEPETPQAEQLAVSDPSTTTQPAEPTAVLAAEGKEIQKVATPAAQIQEDSKMAEPSPTDVSRIDDLLSAPSQVKAEAQSTLPATPAAKKLSSSTATPSASERKRRTNLTQLRSSYALVQCIRDAGGAIDTLQIPELLADYVERHGFASNAQLSDLRDRKVREKALVAAVDNNLLRRTFLRLDLPTATHPMRQVIYLPDLPADRLQAYCEAVKQGRSGWFNTKDARTALTHATETIAVDVDEATRFAKPWHVQGPFRLADLPKDDQQLSYLRQPFRDVISVYRQQFGFLSGELVRLKAFHQACAKFITLRSQATLTNDHVRSLPLSFFWTEAPLDLFLALVPTPLMSEANEAMVLDPQVRFTPVNDLSDQIKSSLGLSGRTKDEVCISIYSLATQLSQLGVVRLQAAEAAQGMSGSNLDMSTAVVEPLHRLPLYNWASEEEQKPLIGHVDAGLDPAPINRFWANVQAICLSKRRDPGMENGDNVGSADSGGLLAASASGAFALDQMEPHKEIPEELSYLLFSNKAWRPFHQLRPSQTKFLYRIALQDIPSATQIEVDRLAHVTLVPPQVVGAVLQKRLEQANEPVDPEATTVRRRKLRFTWPLKLSTVVLPTTFFKPRMVKPQPQVAAATTQAEKRKKTQTEQEREGRITTLNKARQLRERREQDFRSMLEHGFGDASPAQDLRAKIETALAVIRRKYISGDVRFDANAVQAAISRAIRSASGVRSMPVVRAPPKGRSRRRKRRMSTEEAQNSEGDGDQSQQANGDADPAAGGRSSKKRDRRGRRKPDSNIFWTPARKELLRDAAVILRVRDQVRGRTDWSALFQVIDREEQQQTRAVIMAQWRSQYYRMQSLYGEEAYLAALESRWIPVYVSARESGTLQDDGFPAASGFDLVAQIQLLREKIDKNEVQRSLTKPIARYPLPLQLDASTDFTRTWKDGFVQEPVERRFEAFFFTGETGATTKRRETLLHAPFGDEEATRAGEADDNIEDLIAEWAVRIVIASSDVNADDQQEGDASTADEKMKAEFCRGIGDARIEQAMQRLIDAKLIRSISADPVVRRKPGTNFVFTEELLKLLPDPTAADRLAATDLQAMLKHRKEAFEQVCDVQAGVVVAPVEADGEAAALVPLLDSDLISGEVDVRAFEALRQSAALNARVLNDDDLEAFITVKGQSGMMEMLDAAVVPLPAMPSDHVLDWSTDATLRARNGQLEFAWRQRFEETVRTISSTDAPAAQRLRHFGTHLIQAGPRGLSLDKGPFLAQADIGALTNGRLPLAFFSPLTSHPVLVASAFIHGYTFSMPSRPAASLRVVPHVWTTLTTPSAVHWRALLDTLVAMTLQRPGIRLGWLASRFTAFVEGKEVVGVGFADVWAAVRCLLEQDVVEVKTGVEGGMEVATAEWTLHPGRRVVWAGFE